MANWKWLLLIAVLIVILDNHGCNAEPAAIVNGIYNLVSGIWTKVKTRLGWSAPIPATSKQFFLKGKEPSGLRGDTFIEQMYGAGTTPYFATMYSRARTSPVYSAYRVLPADSRSLSNGCSRPKKIEFVEDFDGVRGHDKIYRANTKNKGVKHITRGHLNPSCINSYNADAMKSTFVYSNAVPQYENSNNVVWNDFEQKLVTYAETQCGSNGGTLYLLTGPAYSVKSKTLDALPTKEILDKNLNKLPVPPVLWTAGCCWKGPGKGAEGLGVIGTNKQAGSRTYNVGLNGLQKLLGGTSLFPGDTNGECGKPAAGPFQVIEKLD